MIDVKNLSYEVGSKLILRDVNVQTNARRVAILGRNGSGKTSLARLLCGVVPCDSGCVQLCGVDVSRDRKEALSTVGILFQNPDHQIIFPTVIEELSFGLLSLGYDAQDAKERSIETLQTYGKAHWQDAIVDQLSHGQKQLLCLMSILAMSPKVIILDEPFSGLDLPTRLQLQHVFSKLKQTLIHITHDPQYIDGYEYGVWLEEGRIQQQGALDDVLTSFLLEMTALGERSDFFNLKH